MLFSFLKVNLIPRSSVQDFICLLGGGDLIKLVEQYLIASAMKTNNLTVCPPGSEYRSYWQFISRSKCVNAKWVIKFSHSVIAVCFPIKSKPCHYCDSCWESRLCRSTKTVTFLKGCLSRIKAAQQAWEVLPYSNYCVTKSFRLDKLAKYESFICGMLFQTERNKIQMPSLRFHSDDAFNFAIGLGW